MKDTGLKAYPQSNTGGWMIVALPSGEILQEYIPDVASANMLCEYAENGQCLLGMSPNLQDWVKARVGLAA